MLIALAALLPATASASGCARPWSGSGTDADPYLIANQTDLDNVHACAYSGGLISFRQTADIALTGNWSPIGTLDGYFYGTYDGGGHVISGLAVSGQSAYHVGLFGIIEGGTVRNLTIANATVAVTGYAFGAGVLAGTVRGPATISNVHVTGTSTVAGYEAVGGLAGALQMVSSGPTVTGSSSTATVSGSQFVGGLGGYAEDATLIDSYARGAASGDTNVGGLLGGAINTTITRSYATGRVAATSAGGGLVGSEMTPIAITGTDAFWDAETTGQATSMVGLSKTTAQLKAIDTFTAAGWGIVSTWQAATTTTPWGICATVNDGYPYLLAEHATNPCPAAPVAVAAAPVCTSTGWHFGIFDISKSGYGNRLQVTWKTPTTCDASAITGYTLHQSLSKDGAETTVDLTKCSPAGAGSTGWGKEQSGSGTLHACSFPVSGPDERWFRLTATTASSKTIESRRIAWIRDEVPNADVQDLAGQNCRTGQTATLMCFILQLVIQTEFAANGNQALTDQQMVELLNVGIDFADTQTARSSRAVRWIAAGHASRSIRKSGPVTMSVPLNARATARLRTGSLRIRYTISIKHGAVTKRIVRYTTMPKTAAPSGAPSVTG